MSKRLLQVSMGVLGIIPIATGLIGMTGLRDPLYASAELPASVLLDSNLRFFAGIWLGLGLAIYWLIPNIEKQAILFRAVWGMIFVGGIGRLLSMLLLEVPPPPFIAFAVLEIVGAPLFVFWQAQVAKRPG